MRTVAVIVLNYNGQAYLAECLASLVAQDYPQLDVYIADNGSTDGSRSVCDQFAVRWLPLGENFGFAMGNQLAAAALAPKYDVLVFLNNDIQVAPGFIRAIIEPLEMPDVLAVDALHFPRDARQAGPSHGPAVIRRTWSLRSTAPFIALDEERERRGTLEVAWACGGAIAFDSQKYVELGGFDTRYLAGWEDMDICLRGYLRGWRTIFTSDAVCIHRIGEASRSVDGRVWRLRGASLGRLILSAKLLPLECLVGQVVVELARLARPRQPFRRVRLAILGVWISMLPSILADRWKIFREARTTPRQLLDRASKLPAGIEVAQ